MPASVRGARLGWAADNVAVLAIAATALALLVPSTAVSRRSDLLLAALVALTALGIAPRRLLTLRARGRALAALALAPLPVLTALAWAIGRGFDQPVRNGVLALGLSSSEVASVGLVAIAGGDAVLALGVVVGSLVASAVLGPLLASGLGATAGNIGGADLLGRFALVVLAPLAAGLALRARLPSLARRESALGGLSALVVCALVYAALSGVGRGRELPGATVASVAFLAACGAVALLWTRFARRGEAAEVGLPVALRDFAVAAALATQAFGTAAATVCGIYGVLMLVAGSLAAAFMRHRAGPVASARTGAR